MELSPLGHLLAGRDVVPAVRTVIDGVEKQTLVFGVRGEIRFSEQRAGDGEAGLAILRTVLLVAHCRLPGCFQGSIVFRRVGFTLGFTLLLSGTIG